MTDKHGQIAVNSFRQIQSILQRPIYRPSVQLLRGQWGHRGHEGKEQLVTRVKWELQTADHWENGIWVIYRLEWFSLSVELSTQCRQHWKAEVTS